MVLRDVKKGEGVFGEENRVLALVGHINVSSNGIRKYQLQNEQEAEHGFGAISQGNIFRGAAGKRKI
jgi:hypothetical protein